MKHIPNIITGFRIVGTVVLMFLVPLSPEFYILYALCGISDVADGVLARRWKVTSKIGGKLDSAADILYYAVMLIRILPILREVLPPWVWALIWSAVVIRVVSYLVAALRYKRFAAMHTYLNKLTGFGVFTVPYVIKLPYAKPICGGIALLAVISSLEELLMHLTRKEYVEDEKTLLKI